MGSLLIAWGIHQIVIIPGFSPEHWAWLSSDFEIVDYIKFWFRNHGVWTTANGAFFTFIAAASFKKRTRWAWWALAYLPVHIILLTTQFFWLFFITIPLVLLSVWALWVTRDDLQPESSHRRNYGWVFFMVIGLGTLYFAYDNFFVIPALDVRDPDRGWAWLTTDPEIIDYIKFYFRVLELGCSRWGP